MQKLEDSLKFKQWQERLEGQGIRINQTEALHLVHKPNGELLFALLRVDAQAPQGEKLLPVALLRGHFVSVLTLLYDREQHKAYLLLVKQYRIANGTYSYEHPAGMCDSQSDPYEVALKELEEESGLKIERSALGLLNQDLLYSSPGLLDEGGYFFYCEIVMSSAEIAAYQNKITGAVGEQEFIQTEVVPLQEAKALMSSAMARLNLYMYLEHRGITL